MCTWFAVASRSGGRQRTPLYHNFSTNAAPSGGSCSVDPEKGYAENASGNPLETLFNVSCPNYTDSDEPINYTLRIDYTGL